MPHCGSILVACVAATFGYRLSVTRLENELVELPAEATDKHREFVAEVVNSLADAVLVPECLHYAVFDAAHELNKRHT